MKDSIKIGNNVISWQVIPKMGSMSMAIISVCGEGEKPWTTSFSMQNSHIDSVLPQVIRKTKMTLSQK